MNRSIVALFAALALSACTNEDPASQAGQSFDGAPASGTEAERIAAQQSAETAQNCYETQVEQTADPRDEKKIAGTAIGAVVGGAIGHEIDDSDFATAAGAAAGAYVGRAAQDRYQENRTETVTEVRCD